ncbi:MAG: DUF2784 domain-containing protein [Gammaproteobacteria bacterium]|nr:DUF2784 domain-containing protein [Gammaproteobacteria bacterium]
MAIETLYLWLANLIIVFHFLFIVFVLLGGLLVLKWPKMIWLHLPAITWGFLVELNGWICPLTPWENHFRELAGKLVYEGDFIGKYLIPLIYPDGLTREMQYVFAAIVVLINAVIYFVIWQRTKSKY